MINELENIAAEYPVGSTWTVTSGGRYGKKSRIRKIVAHRQSQKNPHSILVIFSQMS